MVAGAAATSERFSVLPLSAGTPPPPAPPLPTSPSRPPLTLAACCERPSRATSLSPILFSRYEYEYERSAAPGIGDVGGGDGGGDDDDG